MVKEIVPTGKVENNFIIKLGENALNTSNPLCLSIGELAYLTVGPSTDTKVIWSTADSSIASINEYGMITGVNAGSTTLTARCGALECTVPIWIKSFGNGRDFDIVRENGIVSITKEYMNPSDEAITLVILASCYKANGKLAKAESKCTHLEPGERETLTVSIAVSDEEIANGDTVCVTVMEQGQRLPDTFYQPVKLEF